MNRFNFVSINSRNQEFQNYHLLTIKASYYLVLAKDNLVDPILPQMLLYPSHLILHTVPSNQAFQWSHYNEQIKSLTLHFLSSYIPSPINSESILVDPRMGELPWRWRDGSRKLGRSIANIGTDVPYRY